jgi:hypothetical protein
VEVLCQWLQNIEDLYVVNRKTYSAVHVASSAVVLQTMYENGFDLWTTDSKGRYPLFVASFIGHLDVVCFLLEVGASRKLDAILAADISGDTALHASCIRGNITCAALLMYFIGNTPNNHGLTPLDLAERAGNERLAKLIRFFDTKRHAGEDSNTIFGCDFAALSSIVSYYGSRWAKLYDFSVDATYYFDRVTGISQWDMPDTYDVDSLVEDKRDKARELLKKFYLTYNPSKLEQMDDILSMYQNRYTELFIELAERYNVQDLSMFAGVHLD